MRERRRMKSHSERIILSSPLRAFFGVAAGEQQTEIGRLMRVARKFSAAGMRDFGYDDTAQLEPALRLRVELSGLERITHRVPAAKDVITLDAKMQRSSHEAVSGLSHSPNPAFASSSGRPSRFARPTPTKTSAPPAI